MRVDRLLALPADAESPDASAPARLYALHRDADPGGVAPLPVEAGLRRQFRTAEGESYRIAGLALPVPGPALDRLLDRVAPGRRGRIEVTADSTGTTGTDLSPRNLVDGDPRTAWIAGGRPVLHLRWPGKRKIDEIVFAAAGGLSTRPRQVLINSPDGAATAGVDANGQARFAPITTDRLDVTLADAAPLTLHNPVADRRLQLPVGLSEVYVPALRDLVAARPARTGRSTCRAGGARRSRSTGSGTPPRRPAGCGT
ncbi:hypothetical protein NKH77_16610 [Streptomyces sp. M19]